MGNVASWNSLAVEERARIILGVERGASDAEIKKQFWLRAMDCHPDKNPGDPSQEERFKTLSAAYDVLIKGRGEGNRWILGACKSASQINDGDYLDWWKESFAT